MIHDRQATHQYWVNDNKIQIITHNQTNKANHPQNMLFCLIHFYFFFFCSTAKARRHFISSNYRNMGFLEQNFCLKKLLLLSKSVRIKSDMEVCFL